MLYQNSKVSYYYIFSFPDVMDFDGLHQLSNDKPWMTMMHSEIEDLHNETEHAATKSNVMFVFEFVGSCVFFTPMTERNVSCVTKGVCERACYWLYWYVFVVLTTVFLNTCN